MHFTRSPFASQYTRLPDVYVDVFDHSAGGAYVDSGRAPFEFAPGSISGAGGMFSTVHDMTEWYSTLFSDAPKVLQPGSVLDIMKPRMKMDDQGLEYYAQGVVVAGFNATTGWPKVILYEGGTFYMSTAMLYAPRPVDLAVAAFSSVKRLNVTSAAAYRSLVTSRVGTLNQLLANITLGADDGGAGKLGNELFLQYYHA